MTWATGVPLVRVRTADQPKPVTVVLPYYENADFLARQIAGWGQYPAALRAHLSAVVVDDGSPVPAQLPEVRPFPIRLFRIGVDVRWNWLAARNIGAHHAADGWVVLTDMDHVLPVETAARLVHGAHDPAVAYVFSRRESTGAAIHPHSASYFLTRALFWQIGGYDERLSGFYGTDGYFRRRVAAMAPLRLLTDVLVRHEFDGDSSTQRYARKQPADAALHALVAGLPKGSRPTTLSFPYHEVISLNCPHEVTA
jgi:hypothetical protein